MRRTRLGTVILTSLAILSVNLTSCRRSQEKALLPFMFHVFEAGHEEVLGDDFARDLKDQLNENMVWTAPPYFWNEIEPQDNQFNWRELDDFVENHVDKHRVINLGPEVVAGEGGDFLILGEIPDWLENKLSNPELLSQYGALLQAIVSRYRDDIDMWWIGLEVNLGGDGPPWETWREWIQWQVELIREIDTSTKIAVSFGSWSDYHEDIPLNAIHEFDGVRQLIDDGVAFDVVAMEYHYGTLQNGDVGDMREALDQLKATGKEIFLWEVFYPAETDPDYQGYWSWEFPPNEGYTEEWQADQLHQTLEIAFEDPQIIGVNILHFQDLSYELIDATEWEAGWRCYAGLVGNDGTPRQAYFRVRDYWNEVSREQ